MRKFTPEELEGRFILAFDTICDGWDCVKGSNDDPFLYESEQEAQEEIDDMVKEFGDDPDEYFIIPAPEYIHNRKLVYGSEGFIVTGKKLNE